MSNERDGEVDDENISYAEASKGIRKMRLLPQEELESRIEHFLRVKDRHPCYDATNPQDVAGYIAEQLASLALGRGTLEENRELNFYAGVLGGLFDIPRARPTSSYHHFNTYDEENVKTGNQVDHFLTRIGHLPQRS